MNLLDEVERVRERVLARNRQVTEATETDVLAAGHRVRCGVEIAQDHHGQAPVHDEHAGSSARPTIG